MRSNTSAGSLLVQAPSNWTDRVADLLRHHDVAQDQDSPVVSALVAMIGSWDATADTTDVFGRTPHPSKFGPTQAQVTAQEQAEADEDTGHVRFVGVPGQDQVRVLADAAWSMSVEQQAGRGSWSSAKSWAFNDLRRALEPFVTVGGDELDVERVLVAARPVGMDPVGLRAAADLVYPLRWAVDHGHRTGPDTFYAGVYAARLALLAAAKDQAQVQAQVQSSPGPAQAVGRVSSVGDLVAGDVVDAAAEVERLHSWDGLMELLNEHWPDDIFPTAADREGRDPGPRIVSLLRWLDLARGDAVAALEQAAWAITAELVCCTEDEPCGDAICTWGRAGRAVVLDHATMISGLAPGGVVGAGWPRWTGEQSGFDSPGPSGGDDSEVVPSGATYWGVRRPNGVRVLDSEAHARAYVADVTKSGELVRFDPAVGAWVAATEDEDDGGDL